MMSSRYGVLCFLAILAVLLLAFKNYEVWSQPSAGVPPKGSVKKTDKKADAVPAPANPREMSAGESFLIIGEKNIFSSERKEFPTQMVEQQKPIVRPQIVLYGVAIADTYTTASVMNPGRPLLKGEREMMAVKIGDRIGDYQVTKILPDRITLEAAGDYFDVLLYDSRSPKKRTDLKTSGAPAAITSTLTAPTSVPVQRLPAGIAQPISPRVPPGSFVPNREGMIEPAIPRPGTSDQIPDPLIWRGRRTLGSPGSPESGGN